MDLRPKGRGKLWKQLRERERCRRSCLLCSHRISGLLQNKRQGAGRARPTCVPTSHNILYHQLLTITILQSFLESAPRRYRFRWIEQEGHQALASHRGDTRHTKNRSAGGEGVFSLSSQGGMPRWPSLKRRGLRRPEAAPPRRPMEPRRFSEGGAGPPQAARRFSEGPRFGSVRIHSPL